VVAGVCGGLGRATGVDPVVFRVVVAILAVFGGAGILLYLVAWALIPEEGVQESWLEQFTRRHGTGVVIALGVLAAIIVLPAAFGFGFDGGWPFRADFGLLLLIAVIAGIVWVTRRSAATTPPPTPPGAWSSQPSGASPTQPQETAVLATDSGSYGAYGPPPAPSYEPPLPPPPPLPPRERSSLGLITMSLAVLVGGVLLALDLTQAYDVSTVVLLAAPLAVLGLGLIVGAWVGRARWLVFLAIPLVLITALVSAVSTWPGNRTVESDPVLWTVTSPTDLGQEYRLGAGEATLDLSGLRAVDLADAALPAVSVELGAGELTVILPEDISVRWTAKVQLGELRLPNAGGSIETRSGIGIEESGVSAPQAPGRPIRLAASVGLGQLTLRNEGALS
jgi:phage shock protein PspC (stress-responsive transcriptional regulator)